LRKHRVQVEKVSGPPPKDPKLRQRRNKTSTAATFEDANEPFSPETAPELPPLSLLTRDGSEDSWHPWALELWGDIWSSPMAPEYLNLDRHGLVILVHLHHRYWSGEHDVLAELRLQRQCY